MPNNGNDHNVNGGYEGPDDEQPDPHQKTAPGTEISNDNGLVKFHSYQDKAGREAATSPIVMADHPGMSQYPAPALKPDEPEPATPQIPAAVIKQYQDEGASELKNEISDIDSNPQNPSNTALRDRASHVTDYTPDQWKEVRSKSIAYRTAQIKTDVAERISKYPKKEMTDKRTVRERAKKTNIVKDMQARTASERKEKTDVTSDERKVKALIAEKDKEATTQERANKPNEAQVKKDELVKLNQETVDHEKEAEEKYKISDAAQKDAWDAERQREKDAYKERVDKQEALENEAKPGESLAAVMARKQRDFLDTLAKDAYVASLGDSRGDAKSADEEKNVAVQLEENAQAAVLPQMKPGAFAATGESPSLGIRE